MTTAPSTDETIFARASGAGRAGVAVFRISGPRAFEIAHGLCGSNPAVRRAGVREVRSGERDLIDRGLVILFEGPGSFTGEDIAEFHLHGSRAVEAAFAEAVAAAGARPAGPGEFTRRALMNGKLDLAQVEALADLIDAETSQQRKQALGQLEGRLSAVAEGWRARLIAILAPLEADIDFPDEEGVPAAIAERAGPAIDALLAELKSYREGSGAARRLREGVSVAIIGAPNAGKSSLLNALAGADVAIVSERAGTTRDIVETRLDLGGVPVLFADTAGLRDQSTDEIEIEGMRRALARAEAADLRLLVIDPSTDECGAGAEGTLPNPPFSREGTMRRSASAPSLEKGGLEAPASFAKPVLAEREGSLTPVSLLSEDFVVFTKKDIVTKGYDAPEGAAVFHVSSKTGEGMADLLAALTERAARLAGGSESAALTRLRHVEAVTRAIESLERARLRVATAPELAAEDARLAARALGSITGAVDVEDVLGEIFSSFCIGK